MIPNLCNPVAWVLLSTQQHFHIRIEVCMFVAGINKLYIALLLNVFRKTLCQFSSWKVHIVVYQLTVQRSWNITIRSIVDNACIIILDVIQSGVLPHKDRRSVNAGGIIQYGYWWLWSITQLWYAKDISSTTYNPWVSNRQEYEVIHQNPGVIVFGELVHCPFNKLI